MGIFDKGCLHMILVSKFLVLKHDLGVCQNADSGHQTQRFSFRHWDAALTGQHSLGKDPRNRPCEIPELMVMWVGEEGLHPMIQKHHAIQRCPRTGRARTQEPWGGWPSSFDFLLQNSKAEQHYRERHIDILREEGGRASVNSEGKCWEVS